jgi:hypothetical protein
MNNQIRKLFLTAPKLILFYPQISFTKNMHYSNMKIEQIINFNVTKC